MRPSDWIQANPLRSAAVVGLLAGLGIGLAWPITVPAHGKLRSEDWLPPSGLELVHPRESEFSAVRDAPIWGELADAGGVKAVTWRLTGIIADPVPAALVLDDGSTKARRVRVGESLPDGGEVSQITNSGVSYVREGCTYQRLLYVPGEAADNPSCDSGAQAVK